MKLDYLINNLKERIFPYTHISAVLTDNEKSLQELLGNEKLNIGTNVTNAINELLKLCSNSPSNIKRYGMKINLNDSNPDTRVEYLFDAVGMKPAKMDFVNGIFDYGDWQDIWFVKNNRPVMLKSNGKVDYELNHDNYEIRISGESSDIANSSYDGNAMSEIPLIWVKRYSENNYDYIILCEERYDESYKAYAHTDKNGEVLPVAYFPIYEGTIIDNKMRSLSNQSVTASTTDEQENIAAQQNGNRWDKLSYSDCNLMYEMCTLISKNTHSQAVFGQGCCNSSNFLETGTLNHAGQFHGFNTSINGVKLFHCENFYGNYWKRIRGFLNINGKLHLKLTPPYSSNGVDYINTELTPYGTSGGYCSKMAMTMGGRVPLEAAGNKSTFDVVQ